MGITLLADYFPLVSIDPSTILLTLANTAIIMLLYFKFLHQPVCRVLDKRKAATLKEIEDARIAKEKAEATEREYLERLAQSKEEAQSLLAEATRRAQKREEEIIAKAEKSAANLLERERENIERERKRAVNEIKDQFAGLVVLAASAVAEKEINESANSRLIDGFLANLSN
ncbi:MAG: F0F1 ATP synthase subunit B [Oscillospiraceae bacterium]|jgi:F-type H+-transporting ATPase subunit b|nr:F0F1 ATP synthase subunit B [Oscillospiraceae bacterium]